jgi:hypothetical protein
MNTLSNGKSQITAIRRRVAWLALLFCASFQTVNAQISINFDTDAYGNAITAPAVFSLATPLTTLYAPMGVTFSGPGPGLGGAILSGSGTFGVSPISGNNFLAFNPATYASEPETIAFATSMSSVSIYAGTGFNGEQFTMKAYGAGESLLGSDTVIVSANTYGQLDVTSSGISSVVLTASGGAAAWVYDNLSATPAPEPSMLGLIGISAILFTGRRCFWKAMGKKA